MNKNIFNKIKKQIEGVYKKKDFGHDMRHINKTIELAEYLAKKEKADIWVCKTSALLHDISKGDEPHNKSGAKRARIILKKYRFDNNFIDNVCDCIDKHCNPKMFKSKEANILYDADKLQTIGPYGFTRVFLDYFVLKKVTIDKSIEMSKNEENLHFKRLKTKTAKKMIQEQYKHMIKFYKLYRLIK